MQLKHSKFKNTGILFELLVRRVTADTLEGKESKALGLLKKYFTNTELGKEYKLFEAVFKNSSISELKATLILTTTLDASKRLNKTSLRKEKYNLIKEIKEHYNLEEFFKTKLHNYKAQASLYTLIESYGNKSISTEQTIDNKLVILEHLTFTASKKENKTETIIEEFSKYDKDTRILTYKILLDKFNNKYSDFSTSKKSILKEYINSVDNPSKLKDFYNITISEIKKDIIVLNKTTKNEVVKIKLEETIKNLLNQLGKNDKVTNDHIVNLLQYCDLLEELKQVNGKR